MSPDLSTLDYDFPPARWMRFAAATVGADFDELALLAEVRRLVTRALELTGGSVPPVGSSAWWSGPPVARWVALLVLAEHALISDPDRLAAEQVKAASGEISGGFGWSDAAHRLVLDSHAQAVQRRAELGPLYRVVDRDAAARWAATGSSAEPAA